jgi:hypothetical protein
MKFALWLTVLMVGITAAGLGAYPVTAICSVLLLTPLLSKKFRLLVLYRGPGTIYAFKVEHPTKRRRSLWRLILRMSGHPMAEPETRNRVAVGYVGKTVRPWEERIREHLLGSRSEPPKAWADTVVEYYQVFHSKRVTGIGLALREVWYIRSMRPLYNVQHNMGNHRRIKPALAKAQAEMRGSVHKLRVPVPRAPRGSFGPVRPARGRTGRSVRASRFAQAQRVEGRIRFNSNGQVVRSGPFYEKAGR